MIGAFNVQHLESLNDLVARLTTVKVRETIPDSFLRQADQVVNLDLSVEDLRERLAAGKIYPTERVEWALGNFFQERNLAHLRELALREVAESVERKSEARPTEDPADRQSTRGRVLVCLSSGSRRGPALIRRGSRMVGRFGGDWFVAFVETKQESPEKIDAELQRRLLANFELAKELGAEAVRLRADDPAEAVLDFARSHNVGHIVVGRSLRPWWIQLIGRSFTLRLVREGGPFDIHIVSLDGEEAT